MRFYINQSEYIDTSKPIDISIEMTNKTPGLVAWGQDAPKMEPVRDEKFYWKYKRGG